MNRCLNWAVVGSERVECLGTQGHGGMHSYPKEPVCQHFAMALDKDDVVRCLNAGCHKEWK